MLSSINSGLSLVSLMVIRYVEYQFNLKVLVVLSICSMEVGIKFVSQQC